MLGSFRKIQLVILMVILCTSIDGGNAMASTYEINTPILTSVNNFRDVAGISAIHGGTGFSNQVVNNGAMRTGVFYRSNALGSLSDDDLSAISSLGISMIIDLRTQTEIAENPDRDIAGAEWKNYDILATNPLSTSGITSAAAAVDYMESLNRSFVINDGERAAFGQVLSELAAADNAVLFHCTAGKDRAGWVATLLENIAGAPSETVMKDYLATNLYSANSIAATLSHIPAAYREIYAPMLGVQESFLQAGLDQVIASYGSMQSYLTNGLNLDQNEIDTLRMKMVDYTGAPVPVPGTMLLFGSGIAILALGRIKRD